MPDTLGDQNTIDSVLAINTNLLNIISQDDEADDPTEAAIADHPSVVASDKPSESNGPIVASKQSIHPCPAVDPTPFKETKKRPPTNPTPDTPDENQDPTTSGPKRRKNLEKSQDRLLNHQPRSDQTIFLREAEKLNDLYTRYLTSQLSSIMWIHANSISQKMRLQLLLISALVLPSHSIHFQKIGNSVSDWVSIVSEICPGVFQFPHDALFQNELIDQVNLRSAVESTSPVLETFAEQTLVKLARQFEEARPPGKFFCARVITEALMWAENRSLKTNALDEFLQKVNAILEVYFLISQNSGRPSLRTENSTLPSGPLMCFLLCGLNGVFFGPTHYRACTPVGAALLLHLEHLFPKKIKNESFWVATEKIILRKMQDVSDLLSVQTVSKEELACFIGRDFIYGWATKTTDKVPWVMSRGVSPNPKSLSWFLNL